MKISDVVVVAAKRSPMGLFGGSMRDLSVLTQKDNELGAASLCGGGGVSCAITIGREK